MELTPDERRKIYEEEKARLEAREQIEQERRGTGQESTTSLAPNVAGFLCYLGVWISGIVFIVLEQKNKWVRFHAAQSIVTFGILFLASMSLGWIPFLGPVFSFIIGVTGFVLWIVLMVKAFNGETYRVPFAGDVAERIVNANIVPPAARTREAAVPPAAPAVPPSPAPTAEQKPASSFDYGRAGRITGSAFAIAFSLAALIFFNFFHEYVAFYRADSSGRDIIVEKSPFFTSDIYLWLPILTASLVINIIGHVVLIIYDRYALRQGIHIITDAFGLATVVTLLSVFPFDFNVLPDATAAMATGIGVRVVLALIALGFGISIIVRVIKLVVNLMKGTANYKQAI